MLPHRARELVVAGGGHGASHYFDYTRMVPSPGDWGRREGWRGSTT